MGQIVVRLLKLFGGLFLFSLGIAFTLNANIGYAPWDVFHVGITSVTGISIGAATILTGLLIIMIVLLLKEKLGLGTILNMIFVGIFLDFILWLHIIPAATSMAYGIAMLIAGLFILALGTCFYVGAAFGAGPRDSLMVALARKTKWPIGVCRTCIELFVMGIGWLLGGMVGIGTIISVFAVGFCVQLTFRLLKFDTINIQHETLKQTYQHLSESKQAARA